MRTALDSSVILDVVTNDGNHAEKSFAAIREASKLGSMLICECVLAEIRPSLSTLEIEQLMVDWPLVFSPSSRKSALLAGEMYDVYLSRRREAWRGLPDFLIGAHAMLHSDRLLARDRGYYRDYFTGFSVIEP